MYCVTHGTGKLRGKMSFFLFLLSSISIKSAKFLVNLIAIDHVYKPDFSKITLTFQNLKLQTAFFLDASSIAFSTMIVGILEFAKPI